MKGDGRPRVWPAFAALLSAVVLANLLMAGVAMAVAWRRAHGRPGSVDAEVIAFLSSRTGILASSAVIAAVNGGVALASARLASRDVAAVLRLRRSRARLAGGVAGMVGLCGLSLASGAAVDLAGLGHQGTMEAVRTSLSDLSPGLLVVAALALAVLPGLAEETLFRGFVQTRLAARWGSWPAICATAAAFGLIHLDWAQGSAAFALGIYLGWLADRLDGVRPTMLAHVANNAIFVLLSSPGPAAENARGQSAAVLAAGALVCAAAVLFLRSDRAVRAEAMPQEPSSPDSRAVM